MTSAELPAKIIVPPLDECEIEIPPRVEPELKAAPQIRQIYFCKLPTDAHLPEFWKVRPVVIVSFRQKLYGAAMVFPCTTQDQTKNPWARKLSIELKHNLTSWVVVDKPLTVAVSRLLLPSGKIPRLPEAEFNELLKLYYSWLPKLP